MTNDLEPNDLEHNEAATGLVALVTGASRGVGRGIALGLLAAGFRVYGSGRSIDQADLPPGIRRLRCDHLNDEETARVFETIRSECSGLDLLVNCAWGGYEKMVEGGVFTWAAPFWEQPPHRWTGMMDAGVRAAFVCSAHAARMMTPRRRGLIINISFWSAQRHLGNTIYGIAKAATDKMTSDMAVELKPFAVPVISLYPGLVRTEAVLAAAKYGAFDLSTSESPEFIGRVINALFHDPDLMTRTGQVLVAAAVAKEFGVLDVDGNSPPALTLADI
ncbi:NAD(P)-dependent dehydrogenase (short-subunit alcohol dehydrogenase family) [Arthrobacter ginsengisoli]|uniref:NAD(P)-dependent dehydrogenase (Short-subunit alcohol dehydrogenase family) n=1 Tax=Arthrobacter ginsengisoli TaxID=1356565 RepID=A0ABU1U6I9_9MICC|nr:SDR family NAD(P)-dependent oxidoreductase [Arthrobacter ginsengisoli]MDR7080775.1 NAD(P)-dependent dehydrogenase (short-subunit alcohol dehydrogenase family) [Arthrobacter ginsengisoli]